MANESFVIRGQRAFTSPPADAPRLVDLEDGLFAHWHYDDLPGISAGAEYTEWVSRVGGHRLVPISGMRAPTRQPASLNGRGAVAFDYPDATTPAADRRGMVISNNAGFQLNAASTGVTFAAAAFNRSYKGNGGVPSSRLFASSDSSRYYVFGGNSSSHAGIGLMTGNDGSGAQYNPADDSMDGRWFIAVGVITADETRLFVDNLPKITGTGAGTGTSYGFRIGVNAAGATPFTGFLREVRVYKKALSDGEARALVAKMQWDHLRISR